MMPVVDEARDAPPRVFISYAHDSPEHRKRVRAFWTLLREQGVDAQLDAGQDRVGMDWALWSENEIRNADFVLVIASPEYRLRAAGETEPGTGRGVFWEARLLRSMIFDDRASGSMRKILPVVLPGGSPADLPDFLAPASTHYFRVTELTEAGIAELLGAIFGTSAPQVPALGSPRRPRVVTGLTLDVRVEDGRIRTIAALGGGEPVAHEAPVPLGLFEAWRALDHTPLEANAELVSLGTRLFAALLPPDLQATLPTVVQELSFDAHFPIVVSTDDAGLAVPYELVCLPDGRPLATVPGVSFRRRVRGLAEEPARPTPGPLKILAAVAAPTNTKNAPLDVEREMQAIIDVIGPLDQARAQVRILEVASLGQIEQALHRDEYHVLHLLAHGSPSTVELEDEDGNAEVVTAAQLVGALKRPGRRLPLIVLASCSGAAGGDTGLAIELLRHGADRVIAMQAEVSHRYATALLTRVYTLLAERNLPVGVALAIARSELHEELVGSGRRDAPPEWGVATLLAAGDDPPLVDLSVRRDLSSPDVAPSGKEVRELALGELIGRRDQLRRTLRILRGDPSVAHLGANSGVVLTGIGGIGKTALAGRVIARLRADTPPWAIVVHVGRWSPASLLSEVAALLPAEQREALLAAPGEQQLALVYQVLRTQRLLLVFDDFEQNLAVGGGEFLDPGFAEIFANLCAAATTGRLLVTCRYPLPAELDLVEVPVPPLSRAELGRLLLRLPALAGLTGEDRRTIVDTIGGHPRLIEFADALMRGHGGRGRLASVAKRLRELAGSDIPIARRPDQAPGAAEAARQAVILGSRDILLDELLGLLTESQRAALLQAAVSRIPFSVADLALAVAGTPVDPSAPPSAFKVVNGPPSSDVVRAVEADADQLIAITLLTPVDGQVVLHRWVAEALADHQGDGLADRHLRAYDMRWHRVTTGRGGFDDLVEMARHLAAAGHTDTLVRFAFAVSDQLPGELAVAAFLGEVLPSVPRDHPNFLPLMDREQRALIATGNGAAALVRAQEQVTVARARADADPGNVEFQRDLSVSYERLGDLAVAAGDAAAARDWYTQSLEIRRRLVQADPGNVQFQRGLSVSYERLGDLAVAAGDVAAARDWYTQLLEVARRLVQADPGNVQFQRDLAVSYNKLGDLAEAAGDAAAARDWYTQLLEVARRLVQADPGNVQFQRDLAASYERLGDLARSAGDVAAARDWYTQSLEIARRLVQVDPGNVQFQRDLAASYERLGDLARSAGDVAAARDWYTQLLEVARRLVQVDPGNVQFQRDLAVSYNKLGDLAEAAGDAAAARDWYTQALEIAQRLVQLVQADPGNVEFQRDLAISYNKLGDLAEAAGDAAAARDWYTQALEIAQRLVQLVQADPGNVEFQRDLAISYERLGDVSRLDGDLPTAIDYYTRSLETWARVIAMNPTDLLNQRGPCIPHERLGVIAQETGDVDAARRHFTAALEIAERVHAIDPTNAMFAADVAHFRQRLAAVSRVSDGRARRFFQRLVSLVRRSPTTSS